MKFLFFILTFCFFVSKNVLAVNYAESRSQSQGLTTIDESATGSVSNNELANSICQIILILNGKTGRAIAVIALFMMAFIFMMGKLTIPVFLTFVIGMAFLFGAKSIALIMLPSFVKVKEADRGVVKKSPDVLIKEVCPELKCHTNNKC